MNLYARPSVIPTAFLRTPRYHTRSSITSPWARTKSSPLSPTQNHKWPLAYLPWSPEPTSPIRRPLSAPITQRWATLWSVPRTRVCVPVPPYRGGSGLRELLVVLAPPIRPPRPLRPAPPSRAIAWPPVRMSWMLRRPPRRRPRRSGRVPATTRASRSPRCSLLSYLGLQVAIWTYRLRFRFDPALTSGSRLSLVELINRQRFRK